MFHKKKIASQEDWNRLRNQNRNLFEMQPELKRLQKAELKGDVIQYESRELLRAKILILNKGHAKVDDLEALHKRLFKLSKDFGIVRVAEYVEKFGTFQVRVVMKQILSGSADWLKPKD